MPFSLLSPPKECVALGRERDLRRATVAQGNQFECRLGRGQPRIVHRLSVPHSAPCLFGSSDCLVTCTQKADLPVSI